MISYSIWFWHILLSIIPLGSIHVVSRGKSHLFMAEYYFIVSVHHTIFIQFYVDGHLDCFHALAIVNMLQWPWGCICLFEWVSSFSKEPPAVFHRDHSSLHSHQHGERVPLSPQPCHHDAWLSFWWWPLWQEWGDVSWLWLKFLWWLVMLSACWPPVWLLWRHGLFRSSAHFVIGLSGGFS